MIAFVYPGQGAQTVGMGKALYDAYPAARAVIDEIEDRTGLPLKKLMWEGPDADLTATQHAQVALFACGVAATRVFVEAGGPRPAMVAGHSLGEYTSLVTAGALDLPEAADLVKLRGQSMAKAPAGTMAAVLGLDAARLDEICAATAGTVVVANYNTPDQLVISGEPAAVEAAGKAASEAGAKRVVPLNVGGAFHSPLMLPALGPLSEALNKAPWREARCPIFHNVDAGPNSSPTAFADRLSRQLASSVRWIACVEAMRAAGATTYIEFGAGRTLTSLLRRVDRTLTCLAVDDPDSLAKALVALQVLA